MTAIGTTAGESILIPVPLGRIRPSPYNPRTTFDEAALDELAASIRAHGILEPLVARELRGAVFELIAGHRRLLAAQRAGLTEVPVQVVYGVDDVTARELALVENLQRQDLTPIEEAEGFAALVESGVKVGELARRLGKSAPAISNRIRLLKLPEGVRQLIRDGKLSAAHGVALASFAAFPKLVAAIAQVAIAQGLTAHQIEGDAALRLYQVRDGPAMRLLGSWGTAFDVSICERCPFDAVRTIYGSRYCLNVDHWEELQAPALAEREAKALAERQAAAESEGARLRSLAELRGTSYQILPYTTIPDGCSDACPCRETCLEAGRALEVCTDPERFRTLERRSTIARNRARRQRARDLQKRAERELAILAEKAPDELSPRELAPLVAYVLGHPEIRRRNGVAELIATLEPSVGRRLDLTSGGRQLEALAALPVARQVRLALAVIAHAELTIWAENGSVGLDAARWWLGDGGDSARSVG